MHADLPYLRVSVLCRVPLAGCCLLVVVCWMHADMGWVVLGGCEWLRFREA